MRGLGHALLGKAVVAGFVMLAIVWGVTEGPWTLKEPIYIINPSVPRPLTDTK